MYLTKALLDNVASRRPSLRGPKMAAASHGMMSFIAEAMLTTYEYINNDETRRIARKMGAIDGWARFKGKRLYQFCRKKAPASRAGTIARGRRGGDVCRKSRFCSNR